MKPDELLSSTGETVEYARMYIQQQVDLLRLETAKRIATSASNVLTTAVMGIFSILVLIFLSLALGFFLGDSLGSNALAFFIIGLLYLFITFLLWYFKRKLVTNPILSMVIKDLLD